MNDNGPPNLQKIIDQTCHQFIQAIDSNPASILGKETGRLCEVGQGIATATGLPNAQLDELLDFGGNLRGFVFNLDVDEVGCVLLNESDQLSSGARVQRTGEVLSTPVGEELLGRVIDPIGRPLDDGNPVSQLERWPCERDAPGIMCRAAVRRPIQTGVKIVDALVPVGRGQRQLILGDRQSGKTSLAIDTILNQKDQGVICIYCSVGQRSTNVARVISTLRAHDAMQHSIVMIGADDAPPGIQFVAPYAATSVGEYFMERGRDVLIIYDDLTAHARAYRHLSLLLRRPPGREAYPGDIFYIHSRLLERATQLNQESGGGSLTAFPVVETESQNVSAYIPTNLISITDGQIYLSPKLFHRGVLPAVGIGRSVSRVGGKTQLRAYRSVAGDLRLSYSQFEELEKFARFSGQLDEDTRRTLERGRRARQILKQQQHQPLSVPQQLVSIVALTSGALDQSAEHEIPGIERLLHQSIVKYTPELCDKILAGKELTELDLDKLRQICHETAKSQSSKVFESTNRESDSDVFLDD